jgi:large subunit ribosomal protein L32
MGALPKHKITTVQQKTRRAAQQLMVKGVGRCDHCGAPVRSHRMCTACGYYKGRPVIKVG